MSWYNNFFHSGPTPIDAMYGEYNYYMVFLSYVIASISSYVALDMSAHLRKPTTPLFRITWLSIGAFVMGLGIWSMHFVGMLAFVMQMPMSYDLFWTGFSMSVAIIASLFAFFLFMIKRPSLKHYLIAGVFLGTAILTMHYTGMAGMNGVKIYYKPGLFFLSMLIAIAASTAALWLSVQSDHGTFSNRTRLKLGSALIMGLAIAGMHYTGMAAAIFMPGTTIEDTFHIDPIFLGVSVTTVSLSITLFALALSISKYFTDITLKNKNNLLETILRNMTGGVVIFDTRGKVNLFNHTANEMFGDTLKIGTPLKELITTFPLFSTEFTKKLKLKDNPLYQITKGEDIKGIEVIAKHKNGVKHFLVFEGQSLKENEGENLGAVVIFNDISKRKTDEEELAYRATHDILTGLSNRMLLLDRLNQAISSAKRDKLKIIVIFIDLDNFKIVNDALGHTIGDTLLKMVAARFTLLLRSSDTLARIGGDEFVIILPDLEYIDEIPQLLNRMLKSIAEPYIIES